MAIACYLLLGHPAAPASAGYTHYFTWHAEPKQDQLAQCIQHMAQVVQAGEGLVAGPDGTGSPDVSPDQLAFNGVSPLDHEPFVFPGQKDFNFCKTAYKPYDAVVTGTLIAARDCFGPEILEISSDGSWPMWAEGAALYQTAFGAPPANTLSEELGSIDYSDMALGVDLFSLVLWIPVLLAFVFVAWFARRQAKSNAAAHETHTEHMRRSQAHMERVEQLLERLIDVVEQTDRKS